MKQKYLTLLVVLTLVGVFFAPLGTVFAAGASISLVANKSTVAPGSSLIIAVYMNGGGTPINAVQADLSYPASQLQYVGISYSGGAFSINTPTNGGGNGSVSIQNGSVSPISGSALVATVTFKALASSGSAAINVAGSSNLINANDNAAVSFYPAGTSVKFGAVAASAATPAAAAAPAPPKDASAPVISEIKTSDVTPLSIAINWKTDENADSVVEFGLDTNYGLSNSNSAQTTAHAIALTSTFLTPQTSFHYRIKSTDSAGNVATSADQTFQLPGIPVTIIVRGPNGKPQAGATVTIDNATGVTDANGKVTLPSGLGDKKVTTVYQGVSVQKPITVDRSVKTLPPYQLDLSRQPLNRWALVAIALFIIVVSLLGIDALLFGSHFFARIAGLRYMPRSLPLAHQAATPSPTPTTAVTPAAPPANPVVDSLDLEKPASASPHHISTAVAPAVSAAPSAKSESNASVNIPVNSPEPAPKTAETVQLKKASGRHSQHNLKTRSKKD